jgi:sporulation protein YlmC with PRC-barrel domain
LKKTYSADQATTNADLCLARILAIDRRSIIMRSINSALFAVGLAVAPLAAAPHAYSQENHPSVGLFGASEIHSQSADPSSVELAQVTSTMPNPSPSSADTTISVKALLDAKVLDSSNREMGSIKTLLADPQTGKLVRADIGLKGNSGLMSKGDQQLSVPWEQLSVKRQGGSFVLVLNQEAMQKIQTIQKQDTSNKQTQQKK